MLEGRVACGKKLEESAIFSLRSSVEKHHLIGFVNAHQECNMSAFCHEAVLQRLYAQSHSLDETVASFPKSRDAIHWAGRQCKSWNGQYRPSECWDIEVNMQRQQVWKH